MRNNLGLIIKNRRLKLKISKSALAKKAKISRSSINRIERYGKLPSLAVIKRIGRALRVNYELEYLLEKASPLWKHYNPAMYEFIRPILSRSQIELDIRKILRESSIFPEPDYWRSENWKSEDKKLADQLMKTSNKSYKNAKIRTKRLTKILEEIRKDKMRHWKFLRE